MNGRNFPSQKTSRRTFLLIPKKLFLGTFILWQICYGRASFKYFFSFPIIFNSPQKRIGPLTKFTHFVPQGLLLPTFQHLRNLTPPVKKTYGELLERPLIYLPTWGGPPTQLGFFWDPPFFFNLGGGPPEKNPRGTLFGLLKISPKTVWGLTFSDLLFFGRVFFLLETCLNFPPFKKSLFWNMRATKRAF